MYFPLPSIESIISDLFLKTIYCILELKERAGSRPY